MYDSRIYFTDRYECYTLAEPKLKACSFCGILIDGEEKAPFLWRIDLRTGRRELVAWFDKGKIFYAYEGVSAKEK